MRVVLFLFLAAFSATAQDALEKRLVEIADAKALRQYHDLLAARPHRAGSEGDLRVASVIAGHFRKMGLEVEMQELWLYLARPVSAEVEVVAPERVPLRIKEDIVDDYSAQEGTSIGWNAFSGSGEAMANVVYANYGTKKDFEKLVELGVDVRGRIVIARYGGNFRGYKAKFAEAAGAVGLILYTDPADSGWGKGLPYPEKDGGYANGSYIQRGSILTLDYRGDPLTPFTPATKDAKRLDPKDVGFPRIPVQPIGWDAAKEILARMKGASVPDGWQGGLPFRYRVTGGDALKVRLKVEQRRELTKTYNVVGTLKGRKHPDELVVVGAHHDAWDFGAGDPLAGTILVLESARCFAEAARAGQAPARSVVFAAWGAEEFGIMGSTEWVEANRERLAENCIAYLNLDMAAMGMELGSSASPSLKTLVEDVVLAETGKKLEKIGSLGGGSDHVGFLCHLAIPCAALGGRGSKGVSYHSLYDNLAWYRKVVGDDYKAALQLARAVNRFLARLSNSALLPLDPVRYAADVRAHMKPLELEADVARYEQAARAAMKGLVASPESNRRLRLLERAWLHEAGLPGRPWFRNLFAAPDEDSGYAAWVLPALRHAQAHAKDLEAVRELYVEALRRLEAGLPAPATSTR